MRIRSQTLNRVVGSMGALALRCWRRTLEFRVSSAVRSADIGQAVHAGDFIYAAWHESILAFTLWGMPIFPKAVVLISQHQDGEYISQIVEHLGAATVRGSTSRGGRAALRELMQLGPNRHLGITPDGPRGPRRTFQAGAVYVASRTGLPIVPVGFGFSRAWRADSWDRFAVPRPFSAIRCVLGWPTQVPDKLDGESLEHWRGRLEQMMLECTAMAEAWSAGAPEPVFVRHLADGLGRSRPHFVQVRTPIPERA